MPDETHGPNRPPLPVTHDVMVALINQAFKAGVPYREMRMKADIGLTDSEFHKRRTGLRTFSTEQCRRFVAWAKQDLPLVFEAVHKDSLKSDLERSFNSALDKATALNDPLRDFYQSGDSTKVKSAPLQSCYLSFKYSYRWHGCVLTSVVVLFAEEHVMLFAERQFHEEGREREDTVGVVHVKDGRVWINTKEIVSEEPRVFTFDYADVARDDDAKNNSDDRIQVLRGFTMEGFSKFPSHTKSGRGYFWSPSALQRVPERQLSELNIPGPQLFDRESVYRTLTLLTEGRSRRQIFQSTSEFANDATINPLVKDHMLHYGWFDSTSRDSAKPEAGAS